MLNQCEFMVGVEASSYLNLRTFTYIQLSGYDGLILAKVLKADWTCIGLLNFCELEIQGQISRIFFLQIFSI